MPKFKVEFEYEISNYKAIRPKIINAKNIFEAKQKAVDIAFSMGWDIRHRIEPADVNIEVSKITQLKEKVV